MKGAMNLLFRRKKKKCNEVEDVAAAIAALTSKVSKLQKDIHTLTCEGNNQENTNNAEPQIKTTIAIDRGDEQCQEPKENPCPRKVDLVTKWDADDDDSPRQHLSIQERKRWMSQENSSPRESKFSFSSQKTEWRDGSTFEPPYEGRGMRRTKMGQNRKSRAVQCEIIPADYSAQHVCFKCYRCEDVRYWDVQSIPPLMEKHKLKRQWERSTPRSCKSQGKDTGGEPRSGGRGRDTRAEARLRDERRYAERNRLTVLDDNATAGRSRSQIGGTRASSRDRASREIIDKDQPKDNVKEKDSGNKSSLPRAKNVKRNKKTEEKKGQGQEKDKNKKISLLKPKKTKENKNTSRLILSNRVSKKEASEGKRVDAIESLNSNEIIQLECSEINKFRDLPNSISNYNINSIFQRIRKPNKVDKKVSAMSLSSKEQEPWKTKRKKTKSNKKKDSTENEDSKKCKNASKNFSKSYLLFDKLGMKIFLKKADKVSSDKQYHQARTKLASCASELNELVEKVSELFNSLKQDDDL